MFYINNDKTSFDSVNDEIAMFDFIQAIPFSYAALFPVLNPLGSAVIFLTYTLGLKQQTLNSLALRVAINTFLLLVVILLTGSWILRFFGISIPVVQIGGGLVLAYIGWSLLNQSGSNGSSSGANIRTDTEAHDMSFYPLTMPITAGPGCIAVTLTIGAHHIQNTMTSTLFSLLGAVVGILLASGTVFLCYRYAHRLTHSLGPSGTQVIVRLSAFINLCIGIQILWSGIHSLVDQVV